MSKNGSMPALAEMDEDIPTDVHTLKGRMMAFHSTYESRLGVIEKDLGEIKTSIRGGVMALKVLGGIVAVVGLAGPALAWALQHISLK